MLLHRITLRSCDKMKYVNIISPKSKSYFVLPGSLFLINTTEMTFAQSQDCVRKCSKFAYNNTLATSSFDVHVHDCTSSCTSCTCSPAGTCTGLF